MAPARVREALWTAYVWPKGRAGNALQGAVIGSLESRRTRRSLERAQRIVIVHTPGKVGSKAIAAAVTPQLSDVDALFHTHRINPFTLNEARQERQGLAPRRTWYTAEILGQAVQDPGDKKVVVLSAVRDPLQRNLSAFFQNIERFRDNGKPLTSFSTRQADELARLFIERFPHRRIVRWIDSEISDVFGVDPYKEEFDHQAGYQLMAGRRANVGIIRHDRLSDAISPFVESLLGQSVSSLARVNDSNDKGYAELYRAVRQRVSHDDDLVNFLYSSRFAQHFFTESERAIACS